MNEVITRDNFILVRDLLSDSELQNLLRRSLNDTVCEHKHRTYNAYYMCNAFDLDIVYNIYKKIYDKTYTTDKTLAQKIKHVYDDKNHVHCLYLLYLNKSEGMGPHRDHWSSWNMVVSIGDSTNLIINNERLQINQGDVYLFNGGKILHSVSPINKERNIKDTKNTKRRNILKLFKATKDFLRFCFQFRKPFRKHKKELFVLRQSLRRSKRLEQKRPIKDTHLKK